MSSKYLSQTIPIERIDLRCHNLTVDGSFNHGDTPGTGSDLSLSQLDVSVRAVITDLSVSELDATTYIKIGGYDVRAIREEIVPITVKDSAGLITLGSGDINFHYYESDLSGISYCSTIFGSRVDLTAVPNPTTKLTIEFDTPPPTRPRQQLCFLTCIDNGASIKPGYAEFLPNGFDIQIPAPGLTLGVHTLNEYGATYDS